MANYEALFKRGIIGDWYLKPSQLSLYDKIQELKTKKIKKIVVLTHRRFGKSTIVFDYIFEESLTNKDLVCRIGGVTEGTIKEIFLSIRNDIFQYCPKLKPDYSIKEGCFFFPDTNSGIHLFGNATQAEADKSRGSKAHIIYLDEFGFYRFDPMYYLTSVLSPQLDTTDGILILTSTVPRDLTHPFIKQIAEAEAGGYLFKWTIADSIRTGHVSQETHEQIIARCGGVHTDEYKREYMCELIPSTQHLIIPEAQDETNFVEERLRPEYYNPYVCADLGLHDFSVALFGYHDFQGNLLYIEDEHRSNYTTTKDKHAEWVRIEKEREWNKQPRRYSDNDAQQLFDLNNEYKYYITGITKRVTGDNRQDRLSFAESVINKLRIGIKQGKVKIHPRCKFLIATLKYGIWNDKRSDFERTESLGHFDAGICLAYLFDNVQWNENPYPFLLKESTHFISPELKQKNVTAQQKIAKILGKRK